MGKNNKQARSRKEKYNIHYITKNNLLSIRKLKSKLPKFKNMIIPSIYVDIAFA